MNNQISPVEAALVTNDLSKLTTEQRMSYYKSVCESLGLNPLTQPLSYISLNGKLTLYAKRDATDQLRKIHQISINITNRELLPNDVYIVTAKAKDASGREDESMGSVNIAGLKGDALANAYLKAETKAKRRVTLSICGLGLMDETETETIKEATFVSEPVAIAEKAKEVVPEKDPNEKENKTPDIPTFPDKTKIKINKEQAEFLYTTGYKYGFSKEDITADIYKLTKHLKLSEMNNAEFELVLNHFKDNSKRFS